MNEEQPDGETTSGFDASRVRSPVRHAARLVVGDRVGLALWLGLVAVLWIPWRIGTGAMITDTNAIANTLVAVAQGQLAVTELRYPLDTIASGTVQQGIYRHDGLLYGRNYGQAVAALPLVWLLNAVVAVADLRAALAGAWSLVVLALAIQVGTLVERRRAAGRVGAVLTLAAFGWNLAAASPLDDRLVHVVALQASTLLAAATLSVVCYRLVAAFEGRRVGLAAGVATGLASPIALWATVPKRHVMVSLLVVATVFAFAAGRRRGEPGRWHRALPYVFAGLVAWISAFEGFVLVAALAAVDVPTARSNGPRDLLAVGLAVLIALLPTFATNVAISGDPFRAPRLLDAVRSSGIEYGPDGRATAGASLDGWAGSGTVSVESDAGAGVPAESNAGAGVPAESDVTAGSPTNSDATSSFPSVLQIGGAVGTIVELLRSTVGGAVSAATDPTRLWHVFVRSGHVPGVRYDLMGYRVVELTVLESAPLLGALVVAPALAIARARGAVARTVDRAPDSLDRGDTSRIGLRRVRSAISSASPSALSPARQTDLLVVAIVAAFLVAFLQRLPLHAQFTLRYVLPVYPLALYGVARLSPVAASIRVEPRSVARSFLATVACWSALAVGVLALVPLAGGEAVQLQAIVHLVAAAALAGLVAGRSLAPDRIPHRWLAVWLGTTAGLATAHYLLAGLGYFRYGTYAVAVGRRLSELVPIV